MADDALCDVGSTAGTTVSVSDGNDIAAAVAAAVGDDAHVTADCLFICRTL